MMVELRKSPVVFDAETHTYHLDGVMLNGVTSSLIRRAFPDKYKGVSQEILAQAAEKGHELHEAIEFHDNFGTSADEHGDPRIASYERLKQENGLRTIANEYLVSDEEHYASSVDLVMMNNLDEICLTDTKTTWTLDRLSTALQLSIYKRLFEKQNRGLEVKHIYALWLPNKDLTIAELIELKPVADDLIDELIEADLNDTQFDVMKLYGSLPARLADVEDEIVRMDIMSREIKEREEMLKKGLYELMERENIKSFKGAKVTLTRVLPTTSESFDSSKLKEEMPEIYRKYVRTSNRRGSLKITVSNK